MSRRDYKVSELVGMIERGDLQLPEMQRQYVWTQIKVRDLLDSLYREYPSGLILTWQAPHDADVETRSFAVDANRDESTPKLLLLDGQQRLTSLSSILRGEPVTVKGRKTPVEILFNLDHPDELTFITEVHDEESDDDFDDPEEADLDPMVKVNQRAFVVHSNPVAALPQWVRVTDVFKKEDVEIIMAAGVTELTDPRYKKYSTRLQRLRAIKDYVYRAEELEPSKSYEEVTEIFVRVNSLGAKLRGSDLALAQITAKWKGSLSKFESYQAEISKRGFQMDLGVHLRSLIAATTRQSKFLTVGSLRQKDLEAGWERSRRAFDYAVDFVTTGIHIDSPTLLSSPLLLITTAFWADQHGFKIAPEEAAAFRRWFLIANFKGRYSRGSSESVLDQDLAVLRTGGGAAELIQRLTQQMGRLDFTAADLEGRTTQSGVFKAMFLIFKQRKAADWATSLPISPKIANKSDKIEFHHIFPKKYLQRSIPGIADAAVNDIANLAFISSQTNKEITDKDPSHYRSDYPASALEAQLVRFDEWGDSSADYENFKSQRRAAIVSALNEYVGEA
ncbi:MAG: DUF262 domain-containing protein [Microbacteriaceae bacterium]